MIKYLSYFLLATIIAWVSPCYAECEKFAYESKRGKETISIEEIKNTNELKFSVFEITLPEKTQELGLVGVSLVKGCIEGTSEFISIPLGIYKENDKTLTQITMRSSESSEWYIIATYLIPQVKGKIMLDGPSIKIREKLKPNKAPK